MIKSKSVLMIMTLSVCLPILSYDRAGGQATGTESSSDAKKSSSADLPTLNALQTIIQSMDDRRGQLKDLNADLKAAETEEQKIRIVFAINRLTESLDAIGKDFERISTGVDVDTFGEEAEKDFDWQKEVQELLGPVLQELKNMTARPRQLERLRSEVAHYENEAPLSQRPLRTSKNLSIRLMTRDSKNN
ncbi:MAG: hypothetical protein JSW39_03865 [Desulfobacterales bacterium]|nr:MAG: hypothetical protein JSW39_03865 [Desulfobacterales bacterium]